MRCIAALLVLFNLGALQFTLPTVAHAQWRADGVPVSILADIVFTDPLVSVSDGTGGVIVAWLDRRSGVHNDVYAQRLNAGGVPQWTINGVDVCPIKSEHQLPQIVADGTGGAILIWDDFRTGTSRDIYAQRLDAAGAPQWTTDGVVVCTATENQWLSGAVADGAGGAFIVWDDRRSGSNYDVYVQRVDASGTPLWTPDGVALCTLTSPQRFPVVVASAGGAIVAWQDNRNDFGDIFVQRVDAAGNPQWTANGVAVCVATSGQIVSDIVPDGTGGAIMVWSDFRSGFGDIYAQRVGAAGSVAWAVNGVAISGAPEDEVTPVITSDGAGGAIVAWSTEFAGDYNVLAQRVNGAGGVQWGPAGVNVSAAAGAQQVSSIVGDGASGAIVTWSDTRDGNEDVYAQRVDALGAGQWTFNGIPICTADDSQNRGASVADGAGGAILAWHDRRDGSYDVYAHHVTALGDVPTAVDTPRPGPALVVRGAYPNPFSAATAIDVELRAPAAIHLAVFDVAGRRVREMTLPESTGSLRVEFDGRDALGALLPSGVYFCRIQARGESVTRKVVIAR